MELTQWSRKIDKMGRIVLPVRLREQYGLVTGLECPIYQHVDEDGRMFICFEVPPKAVQNFKEARELLEKLGYTVSKKEDE
jgi:bifunctional DNA-binding transcriptional regulator/antitoxin component of YhaV-PrlF toxin-antitoxin module